MMGRPHTSDAVWGGVADVRLRGVMAAEVGHG